MQCIGATTLDEYRKHIEKDPALERRFQPVRVPEPTVDETILILKGLRERYELHHKLRYTDEALVSAAQLSYQYIRSRLLYNLVSSLVFVLCSYLIPYKILLMYLKRTQDDFSLFFDFVLDIVCFPINYLATGWFPPSYIYHCLLF